MQSDRTIDRLPRYPARVSHILIEELARAVEEARVLLARHGYACETSAEELKRYTETDTFYPSAISWDEILSDPLIVAHELIEIAELRKMGLKITKDVVVENLEQVYRAHLRAGEVEMEIAQRMGAYEHLRDRLQAVENWVDDPLVPQALKPAYAALFERVRRALSTQKRDDA